MLARFTACSRATNHTFAPRAEDRARGAEDLPAGLCTDALLSVQHGFVFVANCKAGSSSIRNAVGRVLRTTWSDWPAFVPEEARLHRSRVRTCALRWEDVRGLFRFTIVREPLEKYLSGLDQKYYRSANMRTPNFAGEVRHLLSHESGKGRQRDEHLQGNLFRLGTRLRGGAPFPYSFIGRLENMAVDWPYIVSQMRGISPEQAEWLITNVSSAKRVYRNIKSNLPKSVGRGPSARVDDASVRRFCVLRRQEYECLGYSLPEQCRH